MSPVIKNININICLIFVLIWCLGCGTIASVHEIVSISTSQPGVDVYELDSWVDESSKEKCLQDPRSCTIKKIGVTPFFYKVKRSSELSLLLEKDGMRHIHTIESHLRWKQAFFPDLVLSAILYPWFAPGVMVGVIGAGVDLISGGGFSFQDRIVINFPDMYNEKYTNLENLEDIVGETRDKDNSSDVNSDSNFRSESKKSSSGIYLVFPFSHNDKNISRNYTNRWKRSNQKILTNMYESFSFVDQDFVYERLDMYGLDLGEEINISSFSKDQLMELAYLTNATHFVFLKQNDRYISSVVIDSHSMQLDYIGNNTHAVKLTDNQIEEIKEDKFYHKLKSYFPNSIIWSGIYNFGDLVHGQNFKENGKTYTVTDVEDNTSIFKKALTGFSLSRVDHSKKYSSYDISFSFYWSLEHLSYDYTYFYQELPMYNYNPTNNNGIDPDYGYNQSDSKNISTETKHVKYWGLVLLNNIGPVFHSSIGAFSLYLNVGLAYESVNIEKMYKDRHFQTVLGYQVGWSEFLTQNIFVFINNRSIWMMNDKIEAYLNYSIPISDGWCWEVGVGYYIGDKLKDISDNVF